MSDYKVFIKDFPSRCEMLLNRIEEGHKHDDLEVTGLLMVASAAVNIPYERLLAPAEKRTAHPSGDYEKYTEAAIKFEQVLKNNFVGSCLYPINIAGNWRFATPIKVNIAPDEWDCSFKDIDKMKVKFILYIIRNALAHGNIFTRSISSIIQEIILVSEERIYDEKGNVTVKYYNCISVTPAAFRKFLNEWFAFIKGLKIHPYIVNNFDEMYKNAAIG